MSTMTKQTAANNIFLARVKAVFNEMVYSIVSKAVNDQGEDAARDYITLNLVNVPVDGLDEYMDGFIASVYANKRDRLPAILR